MAEMGYRRSAKKCREKFENVYKYHKRTKDGRAGKADGKTYRFFEQLEALEANHPSSSSLLPPVEAAVPIAMAMPPPRPLPQPPITTYNVATTQPHVTVPSTAHLQQVMPAIHHVPPPVQPPQMQNANAVIFACSPLGTPTSSSSTSSDEEITGMRSKKKQKWKHFFEKLTKDVMEKQEKLQRKFLEALEKRENERRVREEAWKAQDVARHKREHDILAQERSMAAAKDAALISFLQKLSHQQHIPLLPAIIQSEPQPQPPPRPPPPIPAAPVPGPVPISQTQDQTNTNPLVMPATTQPQHNVEPLRPNNGDPIGSYGTPASSSRWPKAEIEALINLRTSLEHKYQDSGPKGPLWEEISAGMRKLGYNRNPKRCKEKWENINKYFKKVKESNKKRREDSKTCPYYHQLEALYREKSKTTHHSPAGEEADAAAPIMAKPQQQWPLAPLRQEKDPGSDDVDHDDDESEDGNDEEDEDQAGGFEIVANSSNASSMGGPTAAENS